MQSPWSCRCCLQQNRQHPHTSAAWNTTSISSSSTHHQHQLLLQSIMSPSGGRLFLGPQTRFSSYLSQQPSGFLGEKRSAVNSSWLPARAAARGGEKARAPKVQLSQNRNSQDSAHTHTESEITYRWFKIKGVKVRTESKKDKKKTTAADHRNLDVFLIKRLIYFIWLHL